MKTLAKVMMVCWLVASFVQSEGTVSPSADSPPTLDPGPSTAAPGPSTEVPGPSTAAPGPSTEAPGPSTEAPGPSTAAPGPSTEAPGPSTEAAGPSTAAPGPSTAAPGPSTEAPGPSTAAPGPSTAAPGPSTEAPGPSTAAPGPSTAAPGPSTEAPGPSTAAPGPSTAAPGPSTAAPGPSTEAPGPSTAAPGPSTAAPGPSTAAPGPSTAAPGPSTAAPGPSTAAPGPSTASTPPSTTALPDPCIPNPCPSNSRCEKRFGNYTCLCLPGLVLQDDVCKTSKVFTGDLRINQTFEQAMADKTSQKFKDTSNEIVAELKGVLNGKDGYITSTVLSLREGSVVAEVENIYDVSSNATDASVREEIANAANCSDCFFAGATLKTTELCSATACDPISTVCSAPDGKLTCTCKEGYVKTSFTDRSCTVCPSGSEAVNNDCVGCSFGYSGVNCKESYLLAVVVVSCVLGGLMLILLIVLIVICCRKSKKAPVKSSPYVDMDFRNPTVPKIPRANANSKGWEPTNLELAESGSTRALFTPDRQGNGMRNFKEQNVSGMAYRTHGHVNPYYENNEDQARRY